MVKYFLSITAVSYTHLCRVWGYDYPGDSRTVDVHIKRIREKVSDGEGWSLQTVWGVGYKFEVK